MTSILIKGGRVISPADGLDGHADVLIERDRIAKVGRLRAGKARVIDAKGLIVSPGLIDMHVHLREPGHPEQETIASGLAAAVAGGFTTVAAMPNTGIPVDNEPSVCFQMARAAEAKAAKLLPVGAITRGRQGEDLADLGAMARAGAAAFSDDGDFVADSGLMRNALRYAKMLGKPIIDHAEEPGLTRNTQINAGVISARLGLSGSPPEAEQIAVERDIALCALTGARLHIAHVSTRAALEAIKRAKRRGLPVTCEATPHHLVLTEDDLWKLDPEHSDPTIAMFDTNLKVRPPLRAKADVRALRAALRSGLVDCIASDHAPHLAEEKTVEFTAAPFGMIGLETTLAIISTELVAKGVIDWPRTIELLSVGPARALGVTGGTLAVGAAADITLIDPAARWTIDASRFRSLSRNSPFNGRAVTGRAVMTLVDGEVRFACHS